MPIRPCLSRALVLALAVAGCGGGGGSTASISVTDFWTQLLDADCARAAQCGGYSDKAACIASRTAGIPQVMADLDTGKRTFDGAAASQCLAFLRTFVTAPCTFSGQSAIPTDPSCTRMFKGTVAAGGACSDGGQCVSGSCAVTSCDGGCCMGTCDPVSDPIAIGGACMSIGGCVSGAYCNGATDTTAGTCAAQVASGQPCDAATFGACAVGLICAGGTCGPAPAEGAACQTTCEDLVDVCDFAGTMTCMRKLAVGAACPTGSGCVDYAFCNPTTMMCVARGGSGDACSATDFGSCLGSLQCTNGTCAFPPAPATCP